MDASALARALSRAPCRALPQCRADRFQVAHRPAAARLAAAGSALNSARALASSRALPALAFGAAAAAHALMCLM